LQQSQRPPKSRLYAKVGPSTAAISLSDKSVGSQPDDLDALPANDLTADRGTLLTELHHPDNVRGVQLSDTPSVDNQETRSVSAAFVTTRLAPSRVVWQAGSRVPNQDGDFVLEGDSGGLIVDFGRELYGGVELEVAALTGAATARLEVRFGESIAEVAGPQSYWEEVEPIQANAHVRLGEIGFRFARIEIVEAGVTAMLRKVEAVSILRDLEYQGSFRCSDERLARTWNVGAETVHLCMQTHLWDGIKRGRCVWAGDLHPAAKVVSVVFGEQSVVTDSLDHLRDESVASWVDDPKWMNGIGAYSLWWILTQEQWYLHHGNRDYLERQRAYLGRLLPKLFRSVDATGRERLDGWRFLDWVTEDSENEADIHAGFQGLFVRAMEAAIRCCVWLGEARLANECRGCVMQLRKSTPKLTKNKQANALLALAGFQDPGCLNRVSLAVEPLTDLTPFLAYAVLEARALAADYGGCLQLIRDYWGAMLDLGATTFWEDFDHSWIANTGRIDELVLDGRRQFPIGFGRCASGVRMSLCHAWSCGVTAWLSEHVLGIRPIEPGSRTIRLAPHLAGLEWAEGTVATPRGIVGVRHIQNKDGSIATQIEAPEGVEIKRGAAHSD
jgi:alpha-L-rhamnosidase